MGKAKLHIGLKEITLLVRRPALLSLICKFVIVLTQFLSFLGGESGSRAACALLIGVCIPVETSAFPGEEKALDIKVTVGE